MAGRLPPAAGHWSPRPARHLGRDPNATQNCLTSVPGSPVNHRRVDSTLLPADTGSHACAGAHTRASTKAGVGPLFMSDPLLASRG